jgi:hypothetical protein
MRIKKKTVFDPCCKLCGSKKCNCKFSIFSYVLITEERREKDTENLKKRNGIDLLADLRVEDTDV